MPRLSPKSKLPGKVNIAPDIVAELKSVPSRLTFTCHQEANPPG